MQEWWFNHQRMSNEVKNRDLVMNSSGNKKNEVKNVQVRKCNTSQFWHSSVFWPYLELHLSDWGDLYTILKLRKRPTIRMKTSKSISAIFMDKKSEYRSCILWSEVKTEVWPGDSISIISQATKLRFGWFLKHWKANSKGYNFCVLHKS